VGHVQASYLDGEEERDRLSAATIRSITNRALETLVRTQLPSGEWPYQLVSGSEPAAPRKPSTSTQAMILHAIAVSAGLIDRSALVPALEGRTREDSSRETEERLGLGLSVVLEQLGPPLTPGVEAIPDPLAITHSSTWGDDDPLTLTWLYELLDPDNPFINANQAPQAAAVRDRIKNVVREKVTQALAKSPGSLLTVAPDVRTHEPHPFILLRIVQLARSLGLDDSVFQELRKGGVQAHFRNALNSELANSSVRDGGFDPASLVFSLEGLLILNIDSVQDRLLDRAVEVLSSAQASGSHWRPVHPITSTPQGLVLLPQSIEVANSFLRICSLWEVSKGPLFSDSLSVFRQYAEWAAASVLTIPALTGKPYTGWQSEHTYSPGTIHLWATSQVVLFLNHYAAMLDAHRARASRAAASLDFKPAIHRDEQARTLNWSKESLHEPLAGFPEESVYRVYSQADDLFLKPHLSGAPRKFYSMLLYGPPGTGKTTFCRAIADRLGFDFITVSPSDFTRAGESGVEARAQELFSVLRSQSRCVVLFDEIDRLLLDRDGSAYGKQGDMFQFMTPSMLTKINDLRQAESCLFVIATNYADRIDAAIKRPGRIDSHLLLLPPNLKQRETIIRDVSDRASVSLWPDEHIRMLARATPLFVFKEIERAVFDVQRQIGQGQAFAMACGRIEKSQPTISLSAYRTRFGEEQRKADSVLTTLEIDKGPWLETCMLAYLRLEADAPPPDDWARTVIAAKIGSLDEPVRSVLKGIASHG
jgi:ATPase family associated with various cellular activities (AAA)